MGFFSSSDTDSFSSLEIACLAECGGSSCTAHGTRTVYKEPAKYAPSSLAARPVREAPFKQSVFCKAKLPSSCPETSEPPLLKLHLPQYQHLGSAFAKQVQKRVRLCSAQEARAQFAPNKHSILTKQHTNLRRRASTCAKVHHQIPFSRTLPSHFLHPRHVLFASASISPVSHDFPSLHFSEEAVLAALAGCSSSHSFVASADTQFLQWHCSHPFEELCVISLCSVKMDP